MMEEPINPEKQKLIDSDKNEFRNHFVQQFKKLVKQDECLAMTGVLFEELFMSDDCLTNKDLMIIIERCKIFARMRPNQKARLIEILQFNKHVVAMVGGMFGFGSGVGLG